MTNKPQTPKGSESASRKEATAVDYVRTKQEVDAAEVKRKAEAQLDKATQGKGGETQAKEVAKSKADDDTDSIQDSSDEPVIEDEP